MNQVSYLKHKCFYCDEKFRNSITQYSHIIHVHGRDKIHDKIVDMNKPINLLLDSSRPNFNTLINELTNNFEYNQFSPAILKDLPDFCDKNMELVDASNPMNECIIEQEVSSSTVVDTLNEICTVPEDGVLDGIKEKFQSRFMSIHKRMIHKVVTSSSLPVNKNAIICIVYDSIFAEEEAFMKHIQIVHTSV